MKYVVYTDGAGSIERKMIGCSYLILTETRYISSDSISVKNLDNPTYAETISVGLAAAYLLDNVELSSADIVEFNIDCLSTIDFYRAYVNNNNAVRSRIKQIVNSVAIVRQLTEKCTVRFQKVRAHKNTINPNTYVDRLAKLAVRRS